MCLDNVIFASTKMFECMLGTWFLILDSSFIQAIKSNFSISLNLNHSMCFKYIPICVVMNNKDQIHVHAYFCNLIPKINFDGKFSNNVCYWNKNHIIIYSRLFKINFVKSHGFKINFTNVYPNTKLIITSLKTTGKLKREGKRK